MENFPSFENKIEKAEVLEMLRLNGFEHPETRSAVIKWTEQQEVLVTNENTAKARIYFEIERADLYIAVKDIEGALDCLEDVRIQAHQENEVELYNEIMKKMDEVSEIGK